MVFWGYIQWHQGPSQLDCSFLVHQWALVVQITSKYDQEQPDKSPTINALPYMPKGHSNKTNFSHVPLMSYQRLYNALLITLSQHCHLQQLLFHQRKWRLQHPLCIYQHQAASLAVPHLSKELHHSILHGPVKSTPGGIRNSDMQKNKKMSEKNWTHFFSSFPESLSSTVITHTSPYFIHFIKGCLS